ncbi:MAG: penicillin-binding protein 2 [Bifidobacteriaceae bacterium]|jgi:peptidoglycan glycosyltransferase|nr:penicillin-binding protein 2 [Bifidobacteriaceae bacterium]
MNKQLRRLSVLVTLMTFVLMGFATYVQFIEAPELNADPRNMRQVYQYFGQPRGSIIVEGNTIVESVPIRDEYNWQRVYAHGELYAAVTGYFSIVNGADRGIEASQDLNLSGDSDLMGWDRIRRMFFGEEQQVGSVELTIKSRIQEAAYEALKNVKGAAIVLNPKTGEIYAMVSTPSYDPNVLASHNSSEAANSYQKLIEDPNNPMLNRAISELYPPGSTFKIIDTVAAFATGKYNSDSTISSQKDYRLPGTDVTIPNYNNIVCGSNGKVTIREALELSCNTPFAELMVDLGQDRLLNKASAFGVGVPIPIDDGTGGLQITSVASRIPNNLTPDKVALAAVGQGDVLFTVLQDALLSAAIANSGNIMQPHLVKNVYGSDMTVLSKAEPIHFSTAMSAEDAQEMTDLMVNNVDYGYAYRAQIKGVKVGGKTGTAQKTETVAHSWFTGFAPADNPEYVVAVLVENDEINAADQAAKILRAALGK